MYRSDDAADLAVVEPDPLAGPNLIEYFGQGAADGGGTQEPAAVIVDGSMPRSEILGQNQDVSLAQNNGAGHFRQAPHLAGVLLLGEFVRIGVIVQVQNHAGSQIGSCVCLGPATLVGLADDLEIPGIPACVGEGQIVADLQFYQPSGG